MIDKIQLLEMMSKLSMGNASSNSDSNSDAFDMIMISLLEAVAQKNSYDNNIVNTYTNTNTNTYINEKNQNTNLDILSSIQNVNKMQITSKEPDVNQRIENAIKTSSEKYGIDGNLIKAIIKVESSFNPNAVSTAGAKGLMQLMPENCRELGVKDPLNIEQNIDGGTRHIKSYLDKYNGNVEMALMAYNGGPGRMARRGVSSIADIYKMPKETQKYVPKVMKYYKV